MRLYMRSGKIFEQIEVDRIKSQRARFNISEDNSMIVGTEDEVETVHKFKQPKRKREILPWYILS